MTTYNLLSDYQNGREVPTIIDVIVPPTLTKSQVLGRRMPWDSYLKGGLINDKELQLIKAYDKKPEDVRKGLVEHDGPAYAELFVTLAQKLSTPETLQYLLTLILDFINVNPLRVELFYALAATHPGYPWGPFLSLATERRGDNREPDLYSTRTAAVILSSLLSKGSAVPQDNVDFFMRWIAEQLRKPTSQDALIASSALQALFANPVFRDIFCKADGVPLLVNVLKVQSNNLHLVYDIVYAVWLLSYNRNLSAYFSNTGIVLALVNIIKNSSAKEKEKITRLSLAALRNMLDKEGNNEEMIDAGLPRMITILSNKKWADEDIIDDIKVLSETLAKNIVVLSSFDSYKKEIQSGTLEWSPVHKSEKFWKENASKFEEADYHTLVLLQRILQTSTDPTTLSIAAFDIGEFARFHPRGRQIIQQLGVKIEIMKLMTHPDAEVKKQSLFAVQKIMVHNWEYLSAK